LIVDLFAEAAPAAATAAEDLQAGPGSLSAGKNPDCHHIPPLLLTRWRY